MRTLLFLLSLGLIAARADDIALTDGSIMKDAKIISRDDKSVMIVYSAGVAKVSISKLPPDLVKTLATVPTTVPPPPPAPVPVAPAAAVPTAEAPPPAAAISQVEYIRVQRQVAPMRVAVQGKVVEVLPEGVVLNLWTVKIEEKVTPHTTRVNTVPEGLGHVPVYANQTTFTRETIEHKEDLGKGFMTCRPNMFAEGDTWQGTVWRIGAYSYQRAPYGGKATVAQYTTSLDAATTFYAQRQGDGL